jgi:hypothetical protein
MILIVSLIGMLTGAFLMGLIMSFLSKEEEYEEF